MLVVSILCFTVLVNELSISFVDCNCAPFSSSFDRPGLPTEETFSLGQEGLGPVSAVTR